MLSIKVTKAKFNVPVLRKFESRNDIKIVYRVSPDSIYIEKINAVLIEDTSITYRAPHEQDGEIIWLDTIEWLLNSSNKWFNTWKEAKVYLIERETKTTDQMRLKMKEQIKRCNKLLDLKEV